ncbi:coiled-coil domain-containing protein 58 isoform X2 [Tetranychus urticae]|uniref:coiled-coil domain-containing protein 58 isoform X2 n=1 Tax=Tetranychus urticae TaxID=32264 RepID=UPI000D6432F3|nr:coiled-coil domain-containing protein 58 isoform X2 [Tetranychus urticae]XP_025017193.1 coiled-coil domain-containing protein 58 isoform X2 [Tetranychus urticae]
MSETNLLSCDDLLAFQDAMLKMRKVDDNIIYALNSTISIDAHKNDVSLLTRDCKDLWHQLNESYNNREKAIKHCISAVTEKMKQLKAEKDNTEVFKKLKKEQLRLRSFQKELSVEEVVKDRSKKLDVIFGILVIQCTSIDYQKWVTITTNTNQALHDLMRARS